MFFAHSLPDKPESRWQPLADHLAEVSRLAARFAEPFGASRAATAAGLLHDLGKYNPQFLAYIRGQSTGQGKGPDHSTAGAREILNAFPGGSDRLIAQLVAHAVAGHHAGLADWEGDGGLSERLKKDLPPLDLAWQRELPPGLTVALERAFKPHPDKARLPFQLSVLGRMIFSCLVDADYLDTEAFYEAAEGRVPDRDWPLLAGFNEELCARFDAHMAQKQTNAPANDLNRLRAGILTHARARAALPPGLFTLNVPTGGGKTLASLGFALDHARLHGLSRIVYAIPFTSVIEQTASVFRDVLGDEAILEHHSAIDEDRPGGGRSDEGRNGRDKLRLAMENWAAPLVVTTNVQLFESLFAARPSRCRKLHNLAGAVIVLDEAQTIPLHVLRPCVAVLDELARNYGATIVLCTATQPALGASARPGAPGFEGGLELAADRELAPNPEDLHRRLGRVTFRRQTGGTTDADLVGELSGTGQGLVIVNSRKHALALYREAAAARMEGLVHLSTRQTAADRQEILAEVRRRLDPENPCPCRLIATSLVEAGVDIDFPRVWRAEAGLEQVMQAAGRCNREGRKPVADSIVTVFRPAEAATPREIAGFASAMAAVAEKHDDLFSLAAVEEYFREVYWRKGEALDREGILTLFAMSGGSLDLSYRSAAERFRLIEERMVPVIIDRDSETRRVLKALEGGHVSPGGAARALQRHLVQVPRPDRGRLVANGHARIVKGFDQFVVLATPHFYTRETGLEWERGDELSLDGGIV
ncbi:CRISPR-associated endonuclease Cas3'' [Stappia sp.]|uniref:CRISPR-associated endonuclease Cas3'' n=1 Tax=Stappia sp. TaxID=1870903 RepID=UPI003D0CCCAC